MTNFFKVLCSCVVNEHSKYAIRSDTVHQLDNIRASFVVYTRNAGAHFE